MKGTGRASEEIMNWYQPVIYRYMIQKFIIVIISKNPLFICNSSHIIRAALLTAGSNNTAHPTWVFFHFFFQRISRICHCSKVKFLTNPAWIANWLQLLVPDKSHKILKQNESTKIVFIWICQTNETNCISVL